MGQRLNIEICNEGKCLANAYYHWAAYTSCSYDILQKIILDKNIKENPNVETAVKLLISTGAGFNSDEMEEAKKILPQKLQVETKGRDEGLISITEEGIKETRDWENSRITINLDTKTVNFGVFWEYCAEDYDEDEKAEFVMKKYDVDFSNMAFEEIGIISEIVFRNEYNNCNLIVEDKNGKRICPIE